MAVEITTNIGIEELHVFSDCQVNQTCGTSSSKPVNHSVCGPWFVKNVLKKQGTVSFKK